MAKRKVSSKKKSKTSSKRTAKKPVNIFDNKLHLALQVDDDSLISGMSIGKACKKAGISTSTYYSWKRKDFYDQKSAQSAPPVERVFPDKKVRIDPHTVPDVVRDTTEYMRSENCSLAQACRDNGISQSTYRKYRNVYTVQSRQEEPVAESSTNGYRPERSYQPDRSGPVDQSDKVLSSDPQSILTLPERSYCENAHRMASAGLEIGKACSLAGIPVGVYATWLSQKLSRLGSAAPVLADGRAYIVVPIGGNSSTIGSSVVPSRGEPEPEGDHELPPRQPRVKREFDLD